MDTTEFTILLGVNNTQVSLSRVLGISNIHPV